MSGVEGNRTPDLSRARGALCLLSYNPIWVLREDLDDLLVRGSGRFKLRHVMPLDRNLMFVGAPGMFDDYRLLGPSECQGLFHIEPLTEDHR